MGKRRTFSYCKDCEHTLNNARYEHKCSRCGKEYRSGKKDSEICIGCKSAELSAAGRERFRQRNAIPENNPWYGRPRLGADNPNYNPDKTEEERELGRVIPGYKDWVRAVYARDGYVCQCCGYDKGGILNAHHLDGYNWCKEKRIDVSNGITLCEGCHIEFHRIYGYRNNSLEQFEEFKSNKVNM